MSMDERSVNGMCIECKYYYDKEIPDTVGCGECRYGPPTATKNDASVMTGYYPAHFPLVSEYEWCWKFEHKPNREALLKECRDDFISIVNSPDTRKRGEDLHKNLSKMTVEDFMKVIT